MYNYVSSKLDVEISPGHGLNPIDVPPDVPHGILSTLQLGPTYWISLDI